MTGTMVPREARQCKWSSPWSCSRLLNRPIWDTIIIIGIVILIFIRVIIQFLNLKIAMIPGQMDLPGAGPPRTNRIATWGNSSCVEISFSVTMLSITDISCLDVTFLLGKHYVRFSFEAFSVDLCLLHVIFFYHFSYVIFSMGFSDK